MLDPLEAYALDLCGYLVLKRALSPDLVERLRAGLVALERLPPERRPVACPVSWTPVVNEVRFLNVLEGDHAFAELIDHPAILARVREIVPGPQRLTEAYSITRGEGVGLRLHSIDSAGYRAENGRPRCEHLTAGIALTDCGPEDGPFVVFAGSHKLGVPFPYATLHPDWAAPPYDRAVAAAELERQPAATRQIAWERIPGYTEVTVEAGDVVLFVQSLWHGAKELRSGRVRRSLYYSYSPYHCPNWHGVVWTDAVKRSVTSARRELLAGPFVGTRYPGVAAADLPDGAFESLPDSELGPRVFDADGRTAVAAIDARVQRAVARAGAVAAGAFTVEGRCRFEVTDGGGEWTVEVARNGSGFAMRETRDGAPAAVVEAAAADLAAVLAGEVDPNELFHGGRLRVRGNLALAMQVASVIGS